MSRVVGCSYQDEVRITPPPWMNPEGREVVICHAGHVWRLVTYSFGERIEHPWQCGICHPPAAELENEPGLNVEWAP